MNAQDVVLKNYSLGGFIMILDQQDERIIARNEQEIKECLEFKVELDNKILQLISQIREIKGKDFRIGGLENG